MSGPAESVLKWGAQHHERVSIRQLGGSGGMLSRKEICNLTGDMVVCVPPNYLEQLYGTDWGPVLVLITANEKCSFHGQRERGPARDVRMRLPCRLQVCPACFEHRVVHVFQDPQEAEQQVLGGLRTQLLGFVSLRTAGNCCQHFGWTFAFPSVERKRAREELSTNYWRFVLAVRKWQGLTQNDLWLGDSRAKWQSRQCFWHGTIRQLDRDKFSGCSIAASYIVCYKVLWQ